MQFNEECVGIARNCLENLDESEFLQKILADALEDSGHDRLSGIARAGGFSVHDLRKAVTGKGVTIEMLESWMNHAMAPGYSPDSVLKPEEHMKLRLIPFVPDSLTGILQTAFQWAMPETYRVAGLAGYIDSSFNHHIYQDDSANRMGAPTTDFFYTSAELADEEIRFIRENAPWIRWGSMSTAKKGFFIHVYGSEQAAADKFINSEYGPTYHRDADYQG